MSEKLLSCEGLGKRYGERWVLKDCTFTLQKGSFSVVVGPSGSGKTTLLSLISGLEKADAGSLWMAGCASEEDLVHNVAVVFQEPSLFPYMSVKENVLFGAPWQNKDAEKRSEEIMELLELKAVAKQRGDQLSGGEKQRVAIGRALMKGAQLIVMDEPFSALDAPLKRSLGEKLRQWQRMLGLTVLYVTHDQQEALRLGDQLIVMNEGEICQQGSAAAVYEHPQTAFVAGFIGTPPWNLIPARIEEDTLRFQSVALPLPAWMKRYSGRKVLVGVMPADVVYGEGAGEGRCVAVHYQGSCSEVQIAWEGAQLRSLLSAEAVIPQTASVRFDLARCIFFERESGRALTEK